MEMNEVVRKVKDIVQSFVKSKKILRMYPQNNPIYINTLEDDLNKFRDFFYYQDAMTLHIRQNEIYFDSEQVYASSEKEENLSLFFFKDGLREITFKKGLTAEELEEFLKIISTDFNREALEDDVVTLFWEKDFQNISYVVDETVLSDEEDYQNLAVNRAKEHATDGTDLLRAYEDAFQSDDKMQEVSVAPPTDEDLRLLFKELEKDAEDKTDKLADMLFEMFYLSEKKADFDELAGLFMNTIEYSVKKGSVRLAIKTLSRITQMASDKGISAEMKPYAKKIIAFAGSETIVDLIGELIDSNDEVEIEDKLIEEYVHYLEKNAIVPFMKILGELKSISARKLAIDALVFLGNKDIMLLAKGLGDTRWYVVRNIIYILRKIGDKRAVDYLLTTLKHADMRVKKEVIRALGELGGAGVLQALRECLDDPEMQVRSDTLKALANIRSEAAKRIILNKVAEKGFRDKYFDEKKEYFEVLSRWKDEEIFNFFVAAIRKKTFFGRAKNYENRACAANGLGLLGNKGALPILSKFTNDRNKLLREYSTIAMKRLEHGQ